MGKGIAVSLCAIGLVLAVTGSGSAGGRSALRPPTKLSSMLPLSARGFLPAAGTFGSATSGGTSVNVKVDPASTGGQHIPGIAVGPNRDVYVVWTDCADTDVTTSECNVAPRIYFARSTDGGKSFLPRVAITNGEGYANSAKLAVGPNGTIYVVWNDDRLTTDNYDVYISTSTDGGVSFGAALRINDVLPDFYWQYEPDIAVSGDGTVYVAWDRYYYDESLEDFDCDIYLAKSTDGGATFGANKKVNDGTDLQYKTGIKVGKSGQVYVVWSDQRNGGVPDVYFAKSTDGGATFSPGIRVNSYTDDSQQYPEIALDDDEKLYVVWSDGRRYTSDNSWDVYMARSVDGGASFEPEVKVNDADIATLNNEYPYPIIAAAKSGNVAVSWEDKRSEDWDVYLRRSFDGGATFVASTRVNDVGTGNQTVPDIAMDAAGRVYATWRDTRNGENIFDIYAAMNDQGISKLGTFRPADGTFYLDANGTGTWDGCGTDRCLQIGLNGDIPLVGDWDGTGSSKVGVFRPSDGVFYLDHNGNGVWDGCGTDRCLQIGMNGDIPLVGDWNGSGTSKVGLFRPADGTFYLDANGTGTWEGCGVDRCLQIGLNGDIPLVGDWDGTGLSKVGVFRPSDGIFYLDYNGSGTWEGCGVDRCTPIGLSTDKPIVGDWNGDGTTKVGAFRPSDGTFYLDKNGNGIWEGCGVDICTPIGMASDTILVGKW